MILLIGIIAVSCKKETGPAGATGATGATGTANVIYSPWTGFDAALWKPTINEYGRTIRFYPAVANDLTQNIIDQGTVMVYAKFVGIPTPMALPITVYDVGNKYIGFRLEPDTINIAYYDLDDTNDPGTFSGTASENAYRYIIIPGGTPSKSPAKNSEISSEQLKAMSYKQVCSHFNIPE